MAAAVNNLRLLVCFLVTLAGSACAQDAQIVLDDHYGACLNNSERTFAVKVIASGEDAQTLKIESASAYFEATVSPYATNSLYQMAQAHPMGSTRKAPPKKPTVLFDAYIDGRLHRLLTMRSDRAPHKRIYIKLSAGKADGSKSLMESLNTFSSSVALCKTR